MMPGTRLTPMATVQVSTESELPGSEYGGEQRKGSLSRGSQTLHPPSLTDPWLPPAHDAQI